MNKQELIVVLADEIESSIAHLFNNEDLDVMSEVSIRLSAQLIESLNEVGVLKELEENDYQ